MFHLTDIAHVLDSLLMCEAFNLPSNDYRIVTHESVPMFAVDEVQLACLVLLTMKGCLVQRAQCKVVSIQADRFTLFHTLCVRACALDTF